MVRKAMFVLCLAVAFSATAYSSPYMVAEKPDLKGAVLFVTDDGKCCAVGQGQTVWFWDENGKTIVAENLPGKVTALALGNLNGPNLVVGTDASGMLITYELKDEKWRRKSQSHYLWDSPRLLALQDLNGDGKEDLVALSRKGEAQILLSWEDRLHLFWKSPPGEIITHLEVVDINNDGIPEIIYTFESGYVGILTWFEQQFITLWENYPWGLIESLFVLKNNSYPEWLVISSQKMVYGWRWQNGEIVPSRHFHSSDVGDKVFYIPHQGLLSLSPKRGISLFNLGRTSFSEAWNIPDFTGIEAFYCAESFLLRDEDYNYFRLIPRSDRWKVYVDNKDISDFVETFRAGSLLYFNLENLGPKLGFSISSADELCLLHGERNFKLKAGSKVVKVDGLPIPLNNPILEAKGSLFATFDFFPLLGWNPITNQARQRVEFRKSWGWWF